MFMERPVRCDAGRASLPSQPDANTFRSEIKTRYFVRSLARCSTIVRFGGGGGGGGILAANGRPIKSNICADGVAAASF